VCFKGDFWDDGVNVYLCVCVCVCVCMCISRSQEYRIDQYFDNQPSSAAR